MKRKHKQYKRPKQIYETERIKEENELKKKYGLKNKKEIWRALAKINYFRHRAKDLSKEPLDMQELFFAKLRALGLNVKGTADVLDLKVENLLERRLPTVVVKKKLATTCNQARQLTVHKKILIDGKVVNSPSYLVPVEKDKLISVKEGKVKKEKAEEKKDSNNEEGMREKINDGKSGNDADGKEKVVDEKKEEVK